MARTNKDRFGNDYTLVKCVDKKGTGYGKGYVEIKGLLFKVEVSPGKKNDKFGNPITDWVKLTKVEKRSNTRNSGGF